MGEKNEKWWFLLHDGGQTDLSHHDATQATIRGPFELRDAIFFVGTKCAPHSSNGLTILSHGRLGNRMSDLSMISTCDANTHLKSVEDTPRVEEDTLPRILVRPGKDVVGGGSNSCQREVLLRIHEQ